MTAPATPLFSYDEVNHLYYLGDELLPGVTTILGTLAKPALIPWAVKMATDHVGKNWLAETSYSAHEIEAILKEAKGAHAKKRDDAATKGTDVHAEIEKVIKYAIEGNEHIVGENDAENEQVKKFIDWAVTNDVTFHESEKKLYSPTHKFAGTVDFTCTMNGKRLVGDIKTTSGIYDLSPFLQIAAYRICLEEMGEAPYDGGVIIRLGKDGSFEEAYRYDAGDDMQTFLALLKVYKAMAKYKNQK